MICTPLSWVRVAACCLALALVASCGNSGTEAVQGTIVSINPAVIGVPVTETTGSILNQQLYTIELKAPNGQAQVNVQMTIDLPNGGTVYEVQNNSTGFTLIPHTPPYLTKTRGTGVETVAIDFAVPGAFSGDITVLEVFSGTAYGESHVAVTCTDSDPSTPPACP
jgi:hypothetical protein